MVVINKMSRQPTLKQRKFAQAYINNNGNGTQAVYNAGYNVMDYTSARALASENLTKLSVLNMIQGFAPTAQGNIEILANKAKNESVRLQANKDIMDRAGFMPVHKSETKQINIEINDDRFQEIMSAYQQKLDK